MAIYLGSIGGYYWCSNCSTSGRAPAFIFVMGGGGGGPASVKHVWKHNDLRKLVKYLVELNV